MPRDTARPPGPEPETAPGPMTGAIRALRAALDGEAEDQRGRTTLRVLLSGLDAGAYAVLILVLALLLVSPLSAIPGATSALGLAVATVLVQMLLGQRHVWLPSLLLDRSLPLARTRAALDWLQRPVGWLERRLRRRLVWMTHRPAVAVPAVPVLAGALCMPLLEAVPGSGSSLGAAISLFAAGLLARDGLIMIAGATLAGAVPLALWLLLT